MLFCLVSIVFLLDTVPWTRLWMEVGGVNMRRKEGGIKSVSKSGSNKERSAFPLQSDSRQGCLAVCIMKLQSLWNVAYCVKTTSQINVSKYLAVLRFQENVIFISCDEARIFKVRIREFRMKSSAYPILNTCFGCAVVTIF